MYVEFSLTKNVIRNELIHLEQSSSKVLETAIFNLNDELISFVLEGLYQNTIVTGVQLIDENGKHIKSLGDVVSSDSDYYVKTEVIRSSNNDIMRLGTLKVFSTQEVIIDRLQYGVLFIIINSFLKILILWIIMIYFLRNWLQKPLIEMTKKIDESHGDNLEHSNYRFKHSNELSTLQSAFNRLIEKVIATNSTLKSQRRNLELEVNVRTSELNKSKIIAEEALSVKTSFLANMSHEVRTPLNGIIGTVHMLEDTELNPEQKEFLNLILSSGDHLLLLLNDVLDLSKIEAGKLTIESASFNIRKLADELAFLSSSQGAINQTKISVDIHKNVPEFVIGDVIRIRQIIGNFMSNAVKFTKNGKVTLAIYVDDLNDETAQLIFKVTDTGIGIKPESIVKLFDPFHQADVSITRQFGGTGLGLSICQQIANVMGAEIEVESEYGFGSTFTFYIKLEVDKNKKPVEDIQEEIENEEFSTYYPQKILLVEDNMLNQKIASAMLKKLGYLCEFASNGQEAVDRVVNDNNYSVVLMDLQMPVMDGFSATSLILGNENIDPPKIIAMTANVFQEDRDACRKVGMVDFISKPISIVDLRNALKKAS
jgi:signal transduction histidine kinase